MSVFIITEAGVNHNGKEDLAHRMVDMAADCGADAIKFQCFNTDLLVAKQPNVPFRLRGSGGGLSLSKGLELGPEAYQRLFDYARQRGLEFMASPFDRSSIHFLQELGMRLFKIPSAELTNLPYLRTVGSMRREVILSTGMSSLYEVAQAIDVLERAGSGPITLLQCNTEYPTPMEDANLLAMQTLKEMFDKPVGYSDHSLGVEVAIAAAALGAVVIEKHVTLDKQMRGPDHQAALSPQEFRQMVKAIRNIEKALGNGLKMPSASEMKHRNELRKSLAAAQHIKRGEIFHEGNLAVRRPGHGVSPMRWDELMGKPATRDYQRDELIQE